jgi:hypothetical protein
MAPELLEGQTHNVRTDIYALAITLWQVRSRELILCQTRIEYTGSFFP